MRSVVLIVKCLKLQQISLIKSSLKKERKRERERERKAGEKLGDRVAMLGSHLFPQHLSASPRVPAPLCAAIDLFLTMA